MTQATSLNIENPGALLGYLRRVGLIGPEEAPLIEVLGGGVSNRTVLVRRPSGESWVLKQALEKLRVDVEWFSSPGRIHREARALHWLIQLAPPGTITPLVFEDYDNHILVMHAVPQPHANWKDLLLAGKLEMEHFGQAGQLLGTIHRNAYDRREELAGVFEDRSYFESLRLEPFYRYSAVQVPAAAPFLEELIHQTLAYRTTFVHGDFSPKNILIYQGRQVLLDHEVAHFGDAAFDIGFCLAHFLSKAHHIASLREKLEHGVERFWHTYQQAAKGFDPTLEERAVRHALACLLARAEGRSKLEYLSDSQRRLQTRLVLEMMAGRPREVPVLVDYFTRRLSHYDGNQN
jgi:5-methylthioribose kinase